MSWLFPCWSRCDDVSAVVVGYCWLLVQACHDLVVGACEFGLGLAFVFVFMFVCALSVSLIVNAFRYVLMNLGALFVFARVVMLGSD